MKIVADTNVLLRLVLADDEAQSAIAIAAMESGSMVAVSIHTLCELAWVLDRLYGIGRDDIAGTIRGLIEASNVVVNRPAVESGLRMMDAGGDFADGAISYEGHWLGGETFVPFDKKAVKLMTAQGRSVLLLG